MSDPLAANGVIRWSFSGNNKLAPSPKTEILDALAVARGTVVHRIEHDGSATRADVRALLHQHMTAIGRELLALAIEPSIVVRRVTGGAGASWDEAVAAALRAAVEGAPTVEQRYARWSVALALQSAQWLAGNGRAVWTAEHAAECRPPARVALEAAALRAAVEKHISGRA